MCREHVWRVDRMGGGVGRMPSPDTIGQHLGSKPSDPRSLGLGAMT